MKSEDTKFFGYTWAKILWLYFVLYGIRIHAAVRIAPTRFHVHIVYGTCDVRLRGGVSGGLSGTAPAEPPPESQSSPLSEMQPGD